MNALILGTALSAEWIEERLQKRGFECHRLPKRPPLPSDPDALDSLSELIQSVIYKKSNEPWVFHPGTSFWAERPELQVLSQKFNLLPLFPTTKILTRFGNKLSLVLEANDFNIPNLLISPNAISSFKEAEQLIKNYQLEYPIVFKSLRAWGGVGVFVALNEEYFRSLFPLWLDQLRVYYGEAIVFAERYLEGGRSISLPFARNRLGHLTFFPTIDSSLQRHNRKLLEFCPSPNQELEVNLFQQIEQWSKRFLQDTVAVGQLEYLMDGSRAFFIGGSARLTTSFPLWEMHSDWSAIDWQLKTYLEENLDQPKKLTVPRGFFSGAYRIYAEDPILNLPTPGKIEQIKVKNENQIVSVRQGPLDLDVNADGLVVMGLVSGSHWSAMLSQLDEAIKGIEIQGAIQTNEGYVRQVIGHPWVKNRNFHTGFLDEEFVPEFWPSPPIVSAMMGGAQAFLKAEGIDFSNFKWSLNHRSFKKLPEKLIDGISKDVFWAGKDRLIVRYKGWIGVIKWSTPPYRPRLQALTGGIVRFLHIREGGVAQAHQVVATLESLRSLVPHAVPRKIKILSWQVEHGQWVKAGQDLAEVELLSS